MSATASPYVGPRAFRRGEALHGRDRETRDLLNLLIAERILLLYSPSGAGKSSIINAGLVPELVEEGFTVLPVVRVGTPPPDGFTGNRYVHSVVASLDDGSHESGSAADADACGDLAAALAAIAPKGDKRFVLILDQFEEILTADAADDGARLEFFQQLGQALKRNDLWALIAMREDYIAGLDSYANLIPSRLATRYRLELLGPDAAAEALEAPALALGVVFEPEAARKLVDNLRLIGAADGGAPRMGPDVEPVHLQITALQLWQRMQKQWADSGTDPGARRIGIDDIHAETDVDKALGAYYDGRLAAIAADGAGGEAALAAERKIRDWFDQRLITPEGVRSQVLKGSAESREIGDGVIAHLLNDYLIRTDDRRSAVWYELAHDRLVKPVRTSNDAWFRAHFSPFRLQAMTWNRVRRSDLLFTGDLLTDSEDWVAHHPGRIGPIEQEFLDECRKARADERTKWRRRIAGFVLMAALLVAALGFSVYSTIKNYQLDRAKAQAELAQLEAVRMRAVALSEAITSRARLAALDQAKANLSAVQANAIELNEKVRDLERQAGRLSAENAGHEAESARSQAETNRMVVDVRRLGCTSSDPSLCAQVVAATGGDRALTRNQIRTRNAAIAAREAAARTRMANRLATARPNNPWGLKLWTPGSRLRVAFLDGSPELRRRVMLVARTWSNFANIAFVEDNSADAEIRISFTENGAWSFVGTDSLGVPQGQPTMALGYVDNPGLSEDAFRQTVLREFGHELGLIQEMQNPNANIPWDSAAVYAALGGPPNNWTRDAIDSAVLRVARLPRYRAFDPHSIMVTGAFPRNYFTRPFEMSQGTDLSDSDKSFIAELYPR